MSRDCFRLSHAPLLFTKAFNHSYLKCSCVLWPRNISSFHIHLSFSQRSSIIHILCVSLPLMCSSILWLGSVSGLSMHLSFSQRCSNFRVGLCKPSSCVFVYLVSRECLGFFACASHFHKGVWILIYHVFIHLVTREHFGFSHAPLLFANVFNNSYLVCKPSSRVNVLWLGNVSCFPMHLSFHKGIWKFIIPCVRAPWHNTRAETYSNRFVSLLLTHGIAY